jgi:HK97 family phage prohead protease
MPTQSAASVKPVDPAALERELAALEDEGRRHAVEGYASVTEQPYDMGSYTEVMNRGAFTQSLARRPDLQLLLNHAGLPLARSTVPAGQVGHLQLSEDANGLHFAAQLDRSDPDAQALMRKVSSGLMDQASFAFKVLKQSWNDDRTVRSISEVDLHRGDVSVVNQGASPTTSVQARARKPGQPPDLAYYQARAQALRLKAGQRPSNFSYHQALTRNRALRLRDDK